METLSAMSEVAVAARASSNAAHQSVWLKSLDVANWNKAAMVLSEAASEAAEMAEASAMCDAGDGVSCRILAEQNEVTTTMLRKLKVDDWGGAAAVLSAAASDAAAVSAAALKAIESFGFNLKHRSRRPSTSFDDDD